MQMPFYLNNRPVPESIHYTPNSLNKMNNTPDYLSGITAESARIRKMSIDLQSNLNSHLKYMEKQNITATIADPFEQDAENKCDMIDYAADLLKSYVRQESELSRQKLRATLREFMENMQIEHGKMNR